MQHVKFKEAGKWADRPCDPILEVEAGQTVLVSDALAKIVVDDAKKGKRVDDPDADPEAAAKKEADRLEAEQKAKADAEAQAKAEEEARIKAEEEAKAEEARLAEEQAAKDKAEQEAAEEQAKKEAEEAAAKEKADAEAAEAAKKEANKTPPKKDKGKAESK